MRGRPVRQPGSSRATSRGLGSAEREYGRQGEVLPGWRYGSIGIVRLLVGLEVPAHRRKVWDGARRPGFGVSKELRPRSGRERVTQKLAWA
jgi:hypothetical protein